MKDRYCKICDSKTAIWYKKLYDDRHGYPGYFNIRKCENCGFAQTVPNLRRNQIVRLYSDYYPRKNIKLDNIKLKNYQMPNKTTLWRKGLNTGCHFLVKPKSKVLDIGSGVGYSLLYLKNNECDAYGIDPDLNAVKIAKKFKLKFHQGFIEDGPFRNHVFDVICASQVLEHTENPIKFLKVVKRRLSDNGYVILSFPNVNSLTRRIFGKDWLHWHIPYHYSHFSKKSITLLANKSGLKIKSLKTVTPNLWTNIQIRRLISKPEMGKRDTFWDGVTPTGQKNKVLNIGKVKKIFKLLEEYNYLNRLIDGAGLGESFVVILEKA